MSLPRGPLQNRLIRLQNIVFTSLVADERTNEGTDTGCQHYACAWQSGLAPAEA